MEYSIYGYISYILETNLKKRIREKKKRNRKRSYVEEIECADFFSFLAKIFLNI